MHPFATDSADDRRVAYIRIDLHELLSAGRCKFIAFRNRHRSAYTYSAQFTGSPGLVRATSLYPRPGFALWVYLCRAAPPLFGAVDEAPSVPVEGGWDGRRRFLEEVFDMGLSRSCCVDDWVVNWLGIDLTVVFTQVKVCFDRTSFTGWFCLSMDAVTEMMLLIEGSVTYTDNIINKHEIKRTLINRIIRHPF